jgi:uncharacterized protein YjiS (DUF1127 family)
MATTVIAERFRGQFLVSRFLDSLRTGWHGFLRRREERRALLQIWRLGPRLVRDAGLDRDAVGAAVGGGWEGLRPGGLLRLASERPPGRG